jgi:enamine deaminase RidA (YjgF/YER057c/UK114 family)
MNHFYPVVPSDLDVLRSQRGYSPGVRTGNLLFVSGMLGRRPDLSIVEEPETQLIQMFDNLGLVLKEADSEWKCVVEMTAFLTELRRDYALFMQVRDRYISEPYPAMTMIGTVELAQPGLICELKAVAVVPD